MSKVTYIPPRPAPRMPPADQVNNADLMLGVVVLAMVIACVLGAAVWWFACR